MPIVVGRGPGRIHRYNGTWARTDNTSRLKDTMFYIREARNKAHSSDYPFAARMSLSVEDEEQHFRAAG